MGDTVPDTVLELTDTVPDTVPDTDSAMLDTVPDTVSDTAMVDTVERDPLMPGTDAVMVVMVDTAVDTVMVDTVLDTDTDVDTDTRYLSNQLTKETILYKIMPLYLPKRVNTTSTRNKCRALIDKDNSKNEREF